MQLTGKMLLDLEVHARKIGTLEAWINIAKTWIAEADEHICIAFHPEIGWAVKPEVYEQLAETNEELEKKVKLITPVYSAIMEWSGSETSIDALKNIVKLARDGSDRK